MSLISPKIIDAVWRMIPGPVRRDGSPEPP